MLGVRVLGGLWRTRVAFWSESRTPPAQCVLDAANSELTYLRRIEGTAHVLSSPRHLSDQVSWLLITCCLDVMTYLSYTLKRVERVRRSISLSSRVALPTSRHALWYEVNTLRTLIGRARMKRHGIALSAIFRYAKILYKHALRYVGASQSDALRKGLRHYAVNYACQLRLTAARSRIALLIVVPIILAAGATIALTLAGSVSTMVCYSVGIGAAIIVGLVYMFIMRTIMRYPEATMTYCLIRVLRQLEEGEVKPSDARVKAMMFRDLQLAAKYLETGIPIAMNIRDWEAAQRFKERCHSGAVELRDIEARIALADDGMIDSIRKLVVQYISIVTQGKYGLLPTAAPAVAEEPKTSAFVRISRNVLVAIIPLGCLIGARFAGLKISGQLADWTIIVAVAWAAITLISTLDPAYRTKIDDIHNIVSIMRGPSG